MSKKKNDDDLKVNVRIVNAEEDFEECDCEDFEAEEANATITIEKKRGFFSKVGDGIKKNGKIIAGGVALGVITVGGIVMLVKYGKKAYPLEPATLADVAPELIDQIADMKVTDMTNF